MTSQLTRAAALLALIATPLAACGDDDSGPLPGLNFAKAGAIAGASGQGSFAFGVATAATQIEDANPHTDWFVWSLSTADGGLGKGTPVGDAVKGYSLAVADVALLETLGVDVYRFSVEWARVEPERDVVDHAALDHYGALLDALGDAGVRPMITVHHFSNPVWVDDPRATVCPGGPSDANLCGWDRREGADGVDAVIEELAEHAGLLAREYGDRVDDWATVNEPTNCLFAAYGGGIFPPGKTLALSDIDAFIGVIRDYLRAHAAMYDAIKANDTVDADGDGVAAHVGFTLSVAKWVPARNNAPSTDPDDLAAVARMENLYHYVFVDALMRGAFDPTLDGSFAEAHPDWAGKLDWLGVQYYFRAGVTAENAIFPVLDANFCYPPLDFGACLPPEDPTHLVPAMHYEFWAQGIYDVLKDFSARWPALPLTVTESGLATEVGRRRAEHVVRTLEQIHRAIDEGVDVRGYYHWSLMDNYEWAEGYVPKFGLFTVDRDTFARTPTEGATVYADIVAKRRVTPEVSTEYGGTGPMTPEPAE